MKKRKKTIFGSAIFLIFYIGMGAMCYRLYLRQAIGFPGPMGRYMADLRSHMISGINRTGYSLLEVIYGFLLRTQKLNEKPAAVLLAAITMLTVYLTWRVIKLLCPRGNRWILHLMAFAAMFVMPLFLPAVNPYRYLGLQSGTIWHNDTYTGMKMGGMLVLLLYFRYQQIYRGKMIAGRYEGGLEMREWFAFTVSLILVNLLKPNFILCFAPAMAIMLLADCIQDRGKTLPKQILFGIPVLISLVVVMYETAVLYQGGDSDSHVVFTMLYSLKFWNTHPIASLFQSAAFPLLVLAGTWRELKTDRIYRVSWLIWGIGLLEYLFLGETGERQNHGNFSWGYSFCMFLVFVVCMCKMYQMLEKEWVQYRLSRKTIGAYLKTTERKTRLRLLYLLAAVLLFGWHLGCGLKYSWMTYLGNTYLCDY